MIENVARVGMALCQNALGSKRCRCVKEGVFKCADAYPGYLAKAAIAAMQAQQWQGIEIAPRDGSAVLLWVPADDGWDAYIASGWYESGVFDRRWYAAVDENPLSPQPTHWMPLPTPPNGGSDAE